MDDFGVKKLLLTDKIVSRFEAALRAGDSVSVEEVLSEVPAELSDTDSSRYLFQELLAAELEFHQKSGVTPDPAGYVQRFPESHEAIGQAFEKLGDLTSVTDSPTQASGLDETRSFGFDEEERRIAPVPGRLSAVDVFPRQFGRYELRRLLGRGGMGAVYLARDSKLDRKVAIKVPYFGVAKAQADKAIERFYREARAMATVEHPNLCPIYDVGQIAGEHYLSMAYIEGQSLAQQIASGPPHSALESAEIIRTLAAALQKAHDAGIIHRDLKPSNVMLREGEPIVMDFGLASRTGPDDPELTGSNDVFGSPAYMSPEQVSADHDRIGRQTDVYALGVIFYQLLCGRRPFEGTGLSVLGQITSGIRPKSPSKQAGVDARLEAICLKAMSFHIEDRYPSAEALATALGAFLERDLKSKAAGRHVLPRLAAGLLSLGCLVLLVVGSLWLSRGESTDQTENKPAIEREPARLAIAPFTAEEAERFQQAWAAELGIPIERENSLGMKLRLIPPGEFKMGASDNDPDASAIERPQHRVRLTRSFWMSDTEVTGEQFRSFIEKSGYITEAESDGGGAHAWRADRSPKLTWSRRLDRPNTAVQCVSWEDARRFCEWLSEQEGFLYRLPTEAEWEYACRAGTTTRYHFGDLFDPNLANSYTPGGPGLLPVRHYPPNAFGLYGMHGNVHEICWDAGREYTKETVVDPVGGIDPTLPAAVRGGALSSKPDSLRSSKRYLSDARTIAGSNFATEVKGFRVVMLYEGPVTESRPIVPTIAEHHPFTLVDGGQVFESDNATGVAAGDLDRDGDIDVIVTRNNAANQVWLNDGIGYFSMHQEFSRAGFGKVALGDLESDGDLDAVFVRAHSDEPGGIWVNDGHGTFTDTNQSLAGHTLWAIELADLDNDTDLDAVVADRRGPNLVFRNDGSGYLTKLDQVLDGGDSSSVKIGDLDADGDNDLFVGNYSNQPNTVWLNDGHGVFTDSDQRLGSSKTHALALADLDLDGDLDAYAANVDGSDAVWINDGAGRFHETKPTSLRRTSSAIAAADLNGDGRNDLFIVNGFRSTPEPGQILLSRSKMPAFDEQLSLVTNATDVALADFDNDGNVDAFVTTHGTPNRVLFNRDADIVSTRPFQSDSLSSEAP